MSSVRLFVDEDAAERAVIEGLRKREVDVVTVIDANLASADDADLLEFAAAERRSLYSLNVADFSQLHSEFLASGRTDPRRVTHC